VWDASWFRVFVAEIIAKADVRNAIGEGVVITSDGNSVATLSVDAETLGALTAHDGDPNAHANVIALHTSNSDPHTQYLTRTDFEAEMAQQYAIQNHRERLNKLEIEIHDLKQCQSEAAEKVAQMNGKLDAINENVNVIKEAIINRGIGR
jgi:predicted RNase H-like nuclease (RuvC/YqgF family)